MAKASDNVFPYVHVAPAAAPASPAAGSQRLYLDSADSNKLKRKDSSGTVVTIEGGAAYTDEQVRDVIGAALVAGTNVTITVNDAGDTITIAASGGGSGTPWTDTLIAALQTALTGWTAGAGTWTAEVDRFRLNSSGTTAAMRLFNNTKLPVAAVDVQVEIRVDASNSSASSRAGILFGGAATDTTGGLHVSLAQAGSTTQTTKIHTEVEGVANLLDFTLGSAIAHSTWMTLRVIRFGAFIDVYLNGTLIWSEAILGTSSGVILPIDMRRFALVGFGVDASFRNLKYRTLTPAA